MSKPRHPGPRPATVRPWYTLASLGVLDSDLTSTRRNPLPDLRDRSDLEATVRRSGCRRE